MSVNRNKKNGQFFVLQRQLLQRRLWMLAGIILYMLLYYPVAVVLLIVRSNEAAAMQGMDAARTLAQRLYEVETWIGVQQSFPWVVVILAVILAINGFSYLFDMEKQDFYESQPISRTERFRNIYINGFLMYEIPMAVSLFLSVACATGMKGMNGLIFLEAMVQLVRLTVCFWAAYSVGILAVMLTGNLIVSGIVAAFLLLIDQFVQTMFTWLTRTFYCTYSYLSSRTPDFMFSPLYNVMAPSRYTSGQYVVSYNTCLTAEQLRELLQSCVKADAANLIIGAVVLLVAIRIYRKRKEEYAGMTVIHRPVRAVIRIVSSVVIALFAGEMVINLFSSVTSRTGTAFMLLGIIVATVLCTGIIEIIYERNVWKFFGHFAEIVLATLAAALIFLVFRYDLTGYDRYVPKTADVASAALYVYNDSNYYYYETAEDALCYKDSAGEILKRMKLTDIDAFEQLALPAMENARKVRDGEAENSWSAVICYHMKNGRDVYRTVSIPYSMDAAVLDAVVASKEYREGLIPIYSDTYVQELAKSTGTLVFTDGFGSSIKESGSLYAAFGEAYKKDLEQFYSYTQLSEEEAIGKVSLRCTNPYVEQSYDIYPSYVNTLAFLKEHNMLTEKGTAEDVSSVNVYEYTDSDTKRATYTDEESIQKILDSSDILITSNWRKTEELYDFSKDLSVNVKERDFDSVYYSVYFRRGEIPDFVERDLDQSLENDANTVDAAAAAR